jgi:hypothetical protein
VLKIKMIDADMHNHHIIDVKDAGMGAAVAKYCQKGRM